MKQFLLFSILSIVCSIAHSQNWVPLGNTIAGEAAGDDFGRWASISADGTTVAAGAQSNDGNGMSAGHVRVYGFDGTAWMQKGSDIDGVAAEDNNSRVSLSANGNTLAVGAPLNDDTGNGSGHVRIFDFDGANWIQRGNTIPSDTANDQSGWALEMSDDGNRIVIGSRDHRSQGVGTGQARVFSWNGTAWVQLGSNINGEALGDQFGGSVALSADGNTFIAGAQFADPVSNGNGEISIYEFNGTDWVPKGNDIPGQQTNGNFGEYVDISADGNTIIASEAELANSSGDRVGRARIFSWNGTEWVQKGGNIDGLADNDRMGIRVAINNSGNLVAVKGLLGAGNTNNLSGNTRIFQFNGTDWVQLGQTIFGQQGDNSGFGLDFSTSGDTISIGFPMSDTSGQDSGSVNVYRFDQPLGVNKNILSNVTLYPNPTNGNFTIDLNKEYTEVVIEVSNIFGQVIYSEKYAFAEKIVQQLNTSTGVYFVKVSIAEGVSKTFKILKN